MSKIKVFIAEYDYKTQKTRLVCREAEVKADGAIMVCGPRPFERKAGDYITIENFNNFWRPALQDKAEEMSKNLQEEND